MAAVALTEGEFQLEEESDGWQEDIEEMGNKLFPPLDSEAPSPHLLFSPDHGSAKSSPAKSHRRDGKHDEDDDYHRLVPLSLDRDE
jgi:hypothetical protein